MKRQGVTQKNFLIILMLCLLSICLMACGDKLGFHYIKETLGLQDVITY